MTRKKVSIVEFQYGHLFRRVIYVFSWMYYMKSNFLNYVSDRWLIRCIKAASVYILFRSGLCNTSDNIRCVLSTGSINYSFKRKLELHEFESNQEALTKLNFILFLYCLWQNFQSTFFFSLSLKSSFLQIIKNIQNIKLNCNYSVDVTLRLKCICLLLNKCDKQQFF